MPEADESTDASPPSYDEASQPGQEIRQPTTLILANQSIHALTPDSPPLYHLSLGIADLSEITTDVELSRVEPGRDGSGRERDMYHLRYMRSAPGGWEKLPSDSPRFSIQRATRRVPGLQDLGIKKSHSIIPSHTHLVAVPIDVSGKTSKYGIPNFVKNGAAVFSVKGREWTDAQGNAVAVMHDDTDTRHSLMVTAAMPAAQFHMLVALWCCHVWEFGLDNAEKVHEGIDGVRRKMRNAREYGWSYNGPLGAIARGPAAF